MTPLDLLEALKAYCEEITKDMRLLTRVPKNGTQAANRPPAVFVGNLPDKESEKKAAPYIYSLRYHLFQSITLKVCRVRIICVTFSEDKQENYIQCLNLLTRIKAKLLEDVVVDDRFSCQKPIEFIVYDDDLEVYQIGEIMTVWEMQQVERDVRKYLT